jgi:hypothetical protein
MLLQVTAERKQWKRFGLAAKESADDSVTGAQQCTAPCCSVSTLSLHLFVTSDLCNESMLQRAAAASAQHKHGRCAAVHCLSLVPLSLSTVLCMDWLQRSQQTTA